MAKVTTEYIHIEASPSVDNYVRSTLEKLTKRFTGRWKKASIRLKTLVSARAPEGQAKEFMAELFIRRPKMAPIVVKKKSPDFRTAVHEAVTAAERVYK